MKMEITERDKKLLIGLAIFVIVVCFGYWGIYPQIKAMNQIKIDTEKQKELQFVNETKLSMLPMLEVENKKSEEEILTARKEFYKMMTSDEVDKMVTGMALGYNLYAYDLDIHMPDKEADLEPYKFSEKAIQQAMEEEESFEVENADAYEDEVTTGIYSVAVTMRLGGEKADLDRMIYDLSVTSKKIHLCSYSFSDSTDLVLTANNTYEYVTRKTLQIKLEIFMCEE